MKNFINNTSSNINTIPVILSGGSGTRLWPLSRSSYPKQYLKLDEDNNYSLLQNTFLRLKGINNLSAPIIISNEEQRFIVAEQMREINVSPNSIILEPFGRNTAPAIAIAALQALKSFNDPLLLILSSDHKIKDEQKFRETLESALNDAQNGQLVAFGIIPHGPETGYGYIKTENEISKENPSSKINKFIEKPDLELAKKLIKDKHYLWNSGIFLFKASIILKELEKYEPKIVKVCTECLEKGNKDLDFLRISENIFAKCPETPIDIAVMEKTSLGRVFSLESGWDDIGSWRSVWKNSKKDKRGNSLKGKIIIENSEDCYIRSEERLIVGIDLSKLIIIETNDAILISHKESSQKIKNIVQTLNKKNFSEGKLNKTTFRPWGKFTNIEKGSSWQVKRLEIKPNASISLQMHYHRSEHWIIVNGTAKVEIDNKTTTLKKNESIYIPLGSKHRLSNPGAIPLILIEVQSGSYLGEDDIVRFEDSYGRTK